MPYADPERAKQYQRDYRRQRRAGESGTTPGTSPLPVEFRLRKASDVLDLLEQQVAEVRGDSESGILERARAIGYLLSIALRAIEAGDLAARLEAVESTLKQRQQDKR